LGEQGRTQPNHDKIRISNKSLKENPTLKCRKCEKLNKLKQNMNARN
jgi:hypothetical protein